jgi:hypothetical protein
LFVHDFQSGVSELRHVGRAEFDFNGALFCLPKAENGTLVPLNVPWLIAARTGRNASKWPKGKRLSRWIA